MSTNVNINKYKCWHKVTQNLIESKLPCRNLTKKVSLQKNKKKEAPD